MTVFLMIQTSTLDLNDEILLRTNKKAVAVCLLISLLFSCVDNKKKPQPQGLQSDFSWYFKQTENLFNKQGLKLSVYSAAVCHEVKISDKVEVSVNWYHRHSIDLPFTVFCVWDKDNSLELLP